MENRPIDEATGLPVEFTCPYGNDCNKIIVDKETQQPTHISRCRFWIKLVGDHPQIENKTIDRWYCAIESMPMLTIEGNKESRGVAASVNSLRNRNVEAAQIITQSITKNKLPGLTPAQSIPAQLAEVDNGSSNS